jgi:excisionase family DNA binding protein
MPNTYRTPVKLSVRRKPLYLYAIPCEVPTVRQLFGNPLPNTAPEGMQAALCGRRLDGASFMTPTDPSAPLALRPRQAAKALGISTRHLWQLTKDGHIPCVRVGSGSRKTVLYPVADLQAWLTRQAQTKGGE